MPTIVFVNEGKAGVVAEDTTVLQAALDLGVKISHVCGGNGTCSTCRIEIVVGGENLSPINPQEVAYTWETESVWAARLGFAATAPCGR